jgi:hypothetical protein
VRHCTAAFRDVVLRQTGRRSANASATATERLNHGCATLKLARDLLGNASMLSRLRVHQVDHKISGPHRRI